MEENTINALDYLAPQQGQSEMSQFVLEESRALLRLTHGKRQLDAKLKVATELRDEKMIAKFTKMIGEKNLQIKVSETTLAATAEAFKEAFPDEDLKVLVQNQQQAPY